VLRKSDSYKIETIFDWETEVPADVDDTDIAQLQAELKWNQEAKEGGFVYIALFTIKTCVFTKLKQD
jgi:hypothetical protein